MPGARDQARELVDAYIDSALEQRCPEVAFGE
jgi:hypothetical protein